jgi:hypothetical protein
MTDPPSAGWDTCYMPPAFKCGNMPPQRHIPLAMCNPGTPLFYFMFAFPLSGSLSTGTPSMSFSLLSTPTFVLPESEATSTSPGRLGSVSSFESFLKTFKNRSNFGVSVVGG